MRILFSFAVTLVTAISFFACKTAYRPAAVQWTDYRVNAAKGADTGLLGLLRPYGDSINGTMNRIIATVAEPLERRQPNGSLGSLLADAMLEQARTQFGVTVHAAFINNGGIRITSLGAGPLTVGKVYEIMPFDNVLILQRVSGAVLKSLLNHIARRGGWPVSGVSFSIEGAANAETAGNITIAGAPLDEAATYTIANSDYIANGGDDCTMLRAVPQINRSLLLRDAFIDYFTRMGKMGQVIRAPAGNRIQQ